MLEYMPKDLMDLATWAFECPDGTRFPFHRDVMSLVSPIIRQAAAISKEQGQDGVTLPVPEQPRVVSIFMKMVYQRYTVDAGFAYPQEVYRDVYVMAHRFQTRSVLRAMDKTLETWATKATLPDLILWENVVVKVRESSTWRIILGALIGYRSQYLALHPSQVFYDALMACSKETLAVLACVKSKPVPKTCTLDPMTPAGTVFPAELLTTPGYTVDLPNTVMTKKLNCSASIVNIAGSLCCVVRGPLGCQFQVCSTVRRALTPDVVDTRCMRGWYETSEKGTTYTQQIIEEARRIQRESLFLDAEGAPVFRMHINIE